ADAVATCKEGSSWEAETVEITFGDGTTKLFEGDFNGCGGWAGGVAESDGGGDLAPEEDAAAAIQVLNESGAPTEVSPEDVNATEAQIEARTPGGGGDGGIGGGTDGSGTTTGSGSGSGSGSSSDSGSSSGCTAAAPGTGSAPFALVLLAGLALIAVMRRRSIPSA
ncbi:MAG: MYXO-CTERM domain-containing protein, partial [Myxococcota bacterium]